MDQDYKRLFERRQPIDLNHVLKVLEPFKADLKGVFVESTYNWYWLVDGLQEQGYTVHLANPSAITLPTAVVSVAKDFQILKRKGKTTGKMATSSWLGRMLKAQRFPASGGKPHAVRVEGEKLPGTRLNRLRSIPGVEALPND